MPPLPPLDTEQLTVQAPPAPLDTSRARGESRRPRDPATGRYLPKLTDEVADKIINALRGGSTFLDAANYAGISKQIFYEWMQTAREQDPPADVKAFMERVDAAMATWKVGATATLTRLGNEGNSRSLEFLLERRFPQEYGRRERVDVGNADGLPFMTGQTPLFDPDLLTDDELQTLRFLLDKSRPREVEVAARRRKLPQPVIEGSAR